MKILITGSQGFIGSYLCDEFLKNGYEVVGIDNYSKYGKVSRPHDNNKNFKLIVDDAQRLSEPEFQKNFKDVDFIIACAAMIGGISYFHKFAYDLLATNERILASTFDSAIKFKKEGQLKRILVLSSSMVFESTTKYPTPEDEVTKCPPPLSTYGFQKLSSEYFCKGAWEQYQLPYTIIRPFNCVGVGEEEAIGEEKITIGDQKMLMSHVLPDLIYRALHLKPSDKLPILGSGDQIRQYTNGKDIARGIRVALESEKAINQDFNISNPRPTTVKELASIVWREVHGVELVGFEHLPAFEYDVQKRVSSAQKAKDVLGFEANVSLEDSVKEVVKWMRLHYNLGK